LQAEDGRTLYSLQRLVCRRQKNELLGPDDIPHIGEHFIVRIQVAVTQTVGQGVCVRVAIVKCDQFLRCRSRSIASSASLFLLGDTPVKQVNDIIGITRVVWAVG